MPTQRQISARSNPRLGEMLLHVAKKCEEDRNFGAVKLNKLLFFADFGFFLKNGSSITGSQYTRQPQGPVPKHLVPVRDRLLKQNRVAIQSIDRGLGFPQQKLIALDEPDLSMFTGEEIAEIDKVIEDFKNLNGTELSDISHDIPAWKIAENGEDIPYDAAFLMDLPSAPQDIEVARKLENVA